MIIGIVGSIGSGKTLLQTRMAYKEYFANKESVDNWYKNINEEHKENEDGEKKPYEEHVIEPLTECQIVTNYKLKQIPYRYINADELFSIKSSLKNARLFIDEMHMFMDSRSHANASVKALTHFILQTRHLGVILYFTTQDIGQVDIRLRKQVDILMYCSETDYKNIFRVKKIDYRDIMNIKTHTFYYNGSVYFPFYDTTEIIDIT